MNRTTLNRRRNLRRLAQAARLDARLADYYAAIDYDGGPVPGETELHRATAADHHALQNWLRHNKPQSM